MKVLFLEDVSSKGKKGEIKEVANGYALHYLLPRGLALPASGSVMKQKDIWEKSNERRKAKQQTELGELAKQIEGKAISFKARAGENGRLHGSITTEDIASELSKLINCEIDKRKIVLEEPLRQLGTHEVVIRFSKDSEAKLKVVIEEEKEK